jgi:hypothetical protein
VSRPVLGPTQPPMKWLWGIFDPGGRMARVWNWPLISIQCKVKNAWSYTSIPAICLNGMVLS